MTGRARPGGLTGLIWALVLAIGGCAAPEDVSSTASAGGSAPTLDAEALRPVTLPDLSRLAEPVQAQVRERHTSLQTLESTSTPPGELADAYGALSLILMAAEFHDAAESGFVNAQGLAPNDRRWPYYLGHLYRMRGEPEAAAAFFERALELRPNDLATLVWLGRTQLDEGRPEAAEPLFEHVLAIEPRSAAALSGLGRAALARRDYARATEYLEGALAVDERASSLRYPLARAYQALGEVETAEAHLARRGTGEPSLADPLMEEYAGLLRTAAAFERRGIEAFGDGRWAAAADSFRAGLELEPDNPSLRHRLGSALAMAGDTGGAVEQFEETLRRSPGFARAHFSLGVILESSGRRVEAIERYSAAVKYQPDYVEARLGLAETLRVTGRLEEALPHYEQVVTIDPGFAVEAWMGGADALVRLKRYQEARAWLAEAKRVYPDRPELGQLDETVAALLEVMRSVGR